MENLSYFNKATDEIVGFPFRLRSVKQAAKQDTDIQLRATRQPDLAEQDPLARKPAGPCQGQPASQETQASKRRYGSQPALPGER